MTHRMCGICSGVLISLFMVLVTAFGQKLDESSAIAQEAAKIEDVVSGGAAAPIVQPAPAEAAVPAPDVAVPAPAAEAPVAVPVETPAPAPSSGDTVQGLAAEALSPAAEPAAPAAEVAVPAMAAEPPVAAPVEPVAEASAVVPPVAEAPVVVPAVEAPVTAPVAEVPAVAAPAAPAAEAPAVTTPVAEAPVAPAAAAAPAAEAPVAAPVAEVPVAVGGGAKQNVEKPAEDLDKLINEATKEGANVVVGKPKLEQGAKVEAGATVIASKKVKPANGEKVVEGPLAEIMSEETLRRRAMEEHGKESIDAAKDAIGDKQYDRAIILFQEAYKNFKRPDAESYRKLASRGVADCYYLWSLSLRRQGLYTNALEKAQMAVASGHPRGESLVVDMKKLMEKPPERPVEKKTSLFKDPEFKAKEKNVSELLKTGREYYNAAEYDKAQDRFESILKMDPYNTEAIRLMQKVTQKKYDTATMELSATRNRIMADVRKTWNPRDYALIQEATKSEGMMGQKKPVDDKKEKILKKMEGIIIPEIDFRQANIYDVVKFLQDASEEYDHPADQSEKKGVNIILNLAAGGRGKAVSAAPAAAPAAGGDLFAAADAAGGGGGAAKGGGPGGEDVQLVTFSAKQISLLEALKIVTQVAQLQFRIQGSVVMILPPNAALDQIITRMYDVVNIEGMVQKVKPELGRGLEGGEFAKAGGGAGAAGGAEGAAGGSSEEELKSFFKSLGVPWPDGSSVRYVKSIGKLIVANTDDNLTQVEKLLAVLDIVPKQIEIETRFVEVGQNDMASAGLEWILGDNWEIMQKKGMAGIPMSSRQMIVAKAGNLTKGNRFASAGVGGSTAIADDLLTIGGVLTNPELSVVLHLLEQKGFADLLSAPKVTAKAGQEATIKVVTEYIYPTQFTVTPITGTGANGQATIVGGVVEPGNFETREVGVILTVTPNVSPEGQMIDLTLAPEVVTDPTWHEYGSSYTAPNGSTQQLKMEQPFFHARKVSTSLSIYNGATIVIGGMITEKRDSVDDKVPFLGDIPLLGRLFRSKYDQSSKNNLLIFVTARLVDLAGRPIQKVQGEKVLAGKMQESQAVPEGNQ